MASTWNAPSTPPPPSHVYTPPTPKHGAFDDNWEPFTPRKSARISAKQTPSTSSIPRTPSPISTFTKHPTSSFRSQYLTPRTNRTTRNPSLASKMTPTHKHGAVEALSSNSGEGSKVTSNDAGTAMLPTPSKTPVGADAKSKIDMGQVARPITYNQGNEGTQHRGKKYHGLSLESFHAEEPKEEIVIYTDSHERVPVADNNNDNPFYGTGAHIGATTRSMTKKDTFVTVPGVGKVPLDEAIVRDDGIVFNFRGKNVFRPFKAENGHSEGSGRVGSRVLTRSTIKPRLLFAKHAATANVDDEAATDIEGEEPHTPGAMVDKHPKTPQAPRFGPAASPPTTVRATRKVKNSPDGQVFSGWARRKALPATTGSKRRAGDLDDSDDSASLKGSEHTDVFSIDEPATKRLRAI